MDEWEKPALNAVDLAVELGASYADVRVEHRTNDRLIVRTGTLKQAHAQDDRGYSVRVIVDGGWGFSSSWDEGLELEKVVERAVQIGRASATVQRKPVILSPVAVVRDTFQSQIVRDPFEVPFQERLGLLQQADEAMRSRSAVRATRTALHQIHRQQLFCSSEGSLIKQDQYETGTELVATAVSGTEFQQRSFKNSLQVGWEYIEELELVTKAGQIADEAVALLHADRCPTGIRTVIIGGELMMLVIHETLGHPIELDRVFGTEITNAGTSFLTPDKLGHYRYGAPCVNFTADATIPMGTGSFGYDDEGVPAQRVPVVRDGIFVGYLTSRETAFEIGEPTSNGAMRSDGWGAIPLIRMTNINLEPGDWKLDDIIADTEDGILLDTSRSHSIDDKRLNFHFAAEIGYEIKNGKRGRMLKDCSFTGISPEFWGNCDAIADADSWQLWGTTCGKGEPLQGVHIGHGCSPARFRRVNVEATR